jgi:hypothetical protein
LKKTDKNWRKTEKKSTSRQQSATLSLRQTHLEKKVGGNMKIFGIFLFFGIFSLAAEAYMGQKIRVQAHHVRRRMAEQEPGPPPPDRPNAGFLEQQKAFTENLQVLTQQVPAAPVPGKVVTF